jgi:hypothetical protein
VCFSSYLHGASLVVGAEILKAASVTKRGDVGNPIKGFYPLFTVEKAKFRESCGIF